MKFERSNDVEWKSEVQVQTVTDDDPNACLTAHAIIQLVQYDNWLRPVFAVIWEVNHCRAGEILGPQTRKHLGDFDSFFEAAERADYVYLRRLTKQYLDLALPEETRKAYAA